MNPVDVLYEFGLRGVRTFLFVDRDRVKRARAQIAAHVREEPHGPEWDVLAPLSALRLIQAAKRARKLLAADFRALLVTQFPGCESHVIDLLSMLREGSPVMVSRDGLMLVFYSWSNLLTRNTKRRCVTTEDVASWEPGSDAAEAMRRILRGIPSHPEYPAVDELRAVVGSLHARHNARAALDDVLAEMKEAA